MAQMQIDIGASLGTPGVSRNDGVSGSQVTITATGPGSVHTFRILTSTEASPPGVTQASPTTWTFTPNNGAHSYFLELVTDGVSTRRVLRIPTTNKGYLLPVPQEGCDPNASQFNNGADVIARSHDNAGGNYYGWAPRMDAMLRDLDTLGGAASTFTNAKSVEFDASLQQYLYTDAGDDAGDISTPNSLFTFSIWFNTTSAAGQVITQLLAADALAALYSDFSIAMDVVGDIGVTLRDTTQSTVSAVTTNGAYNDGVWHLAVATWDGVNVTLFVDPGDPGGQTATAAIGARFGSTANPQSAGLYLGYSVGAPTYFEGHLDEAAYWNDSFGLAAATELFDSRRAMNLLAHSKAANLESWWRLGDYALDSTDSNNAAARIYDVGPAAYSINLTPVNMAAGSISTVTYVPSGISAAVVVEEQVAINESVTGTTRDYVGSVYIAAAGTYTMRGILGTDDLAATTTLTFERFTNASLLCTLTHSGATVWEAVAATPVTVITPDWYDLFLVSSVVTATASVKGLRVTQL